MKRNFTLIGWCVVGAGVVSLVLVSGGSRIAAQESGAETETASGSQSESKPESGPPFGRGMGPGTVPTWEPLEVTDEEAREPAEDARLFVPMPPKVRGIMRERMKQFLTTLAQIQGLLAEEKLAEAAEAAETTMGRSTRGQHQGGPGPGRYMPVPMRTLAWGLHDAASEFAETAVGGDLKASYLALQKVQGTCVACHLAYRTR